MGAAGQKYNYTFGQRACLRKLITVVDDVLCGVVT